jgi:translation initiation factor IF-1
MHTKVLLGKLKGKDHFEVLGADGRIILNRILSKQNMNVWAVSIWVNMGYSFGLL